PPLLFVSIAMALVSRVSQAALGWNKLRSLWNQGRHLDLGMLWGTGGRRALPQRDMEGAPRAISKQCEINGLLGLQLPEHLGVLLAGLHVFPIDRDEDIAPQDPRLSLNGHIQFAGTKPNRLGRAS